MPDNDEFVNAALSAHESAAAMATMAKQLTELREAASQIGMPSFETRIRELAARRPTVMLSEALRLLDSRAPLDSVSIQDRAEWVLTQEDIVDLLEHKKIQAIKETRARTALGLREAKEAVELAWQLRQDGWMTPSEREKLAIEEAAAIRSILGDGAS